MKFLNFAARALFPHFCADCGLEGTVLCPPCRGKITGHLIVACPSCGEGTDGGQCGSRLCAARTHLDGLASMLPYALPVTRKIVGLYKYEQVDEAGAVTAQIFRALVKTNAESLHPRGAIVVAAPMHRFREALRGFNQADALAQVFAQETGGRLEKRVLRKLFKLRRQAEMHDPGDRARNAQNSIAVARRFPPQTDFVIIDDVFTTGATLNACARALKKAGAGTVKAVTFLKG